MENRVLTVERVLKEHLEDAMRYGVEDKAYSYAANCASAERLDILLDMLTTHARFRHQERTNRDRTKARVYTAPSHSCGTSSEFAEALGL